MQHNPKAFGRAADWQLRAVIAHRRSARRAAIAAALAALALSAGAGIAAAFNQPALVALLAIGAFGALLLGIAAASEA